MRSRGRRILVLVIPVCVGLALAWVLTMAVQVDAARANGPNVDTFVTGQTRTQRIFQAAAEEFFLSPNSSFFTLTASTPAHQALNVSPNTAISLTFNAAPDPSTVTTGTLGLHGSQGGYTWTYLQAGSSLVITPSATFFPGEQVRLAASSGISSTIGDSLYPVQLQFTAAASGPAYCLRAFGDIGAGLFGLSNGSVAWGDYDNDGDLDILVEGATSGSYQSLVYQNDGGVFTDIGAGLLGLYNGSAVWGDYDNDGDLDILLTGYDGSSSYSLVYQNDGGAFTDIGAGLKGLYLSRAAWGDYDNDGDLDILLAGNEGGTPYSLVYRNDAGAFTDIGAGLPGLGYSSVDWGDYDNDGDLDILLAGYNGVNPYSLVYRNDAGVFSDTGAGLLGVYNGSAAWGDYDSDGDLDILLTGYNAGYHSLIYANDGGSFTDINAGMIGIHQGVGDWGDYDNDGDLDVLLTGWSTYGSNTYVYRNDSGAFVNSNAGVIGGQYAGGDWGDYDNDGDLDLLVNGYSNGFFSRIYRNEEGCQPVDDTYATPDNYSLSVPAWAGVLANDTNNGYTATLVTGPANGILDFQPDGSFVFTPTVDYSGTDAFVYQLYSFPNLTATVSINVYPHFELTASAPAHQASNVPVNTAINLTFDSTLDPATITSQTLALYGSQGGYTLTQAVMGNLLAITPTRDFFAGEQVRLVAAGGILDSQGAQLLPKQLQFTTAASGPEYCRRAFSDIGTGLVGLKDSSAAWGDYDNDGDLDVLLTGNNGGYQSLIYRNDGGAFTDTGASLIGVDYGGAAWGDYDNDGDLDILITGSGNSRIYRNDAGSFTDITAGLLGMYFSGADWGDYDNDGDLDVLLNGSNNGFHSLIYRNDGGVFTDIGANLLGMAYGTADWADYDNDGDLDILLTGLNLGYHSVIYRNDAGIFTDISAGLFGVDYSSVDWGDYDNDGDLDILVVGENFYGYTRIYRNDAGAFSDIGAGLPGVSKGSAAWGDYDNDGDLDFLLTGYYSGGENSRIYRNDAGSFTEIDAGLLGVQHGSLDWGDYDGDGDLDLLLTGSNSLTPYSLIYRNGEGCGAFDDSYRIYENSKLLASASSGVLANDTSYGYTATLVTGPDHGVLDFQADGGFVYTPTIDYNGLDAFVYQLYSWSNLTATVTIELTPTFGLVSSTPAHQALNVPGGTTISLTFDSLLESATVTTQTLAMYGSQGVHTWTQVIDGGTLVISPAAPFFPGEQVRLAASGGILDLLGDHLLPQQLQFTAAASGPEYCLRSFNDTGAGLLDVSSSSVGWGDYDNDGDLDILLSGENAGTRYSRIYENNSGVFTDIGAGLPGLSSGSAAWGDYDNDGDLDILLIGGDDSVPTVRYSLVFRNDGGVYTDIGAGLLGVSFGGGSWGDYDNDGDLDILLTGYNGGTQYSLVYRNDGGVFTDIGAGLLGMYYSSASWGDYDNDGDLDILLTGYNGGTQYSLIYRNDSGVFTDIGAGLTGLWLGSASWGDYDSDGDLDILLTGNNAGVRQSLIYRNDAGSFTDIGAGLLAVDGSQARWGDYDNDGDLDILLIGYNGSYNSLVYRNDGGIFTDASAGLLGVNHGSIDWGDFDSDGDLDILLTGKNVGTPYSRIYRNDEGCSPVDDSYDALQDSSLTVLTSTGVLTNDIHNNYTATLVTGPANGLLDFHPDGSFVYTPTLQYAGPDSFVYQFSSFSNLTATVSITVHPVGPSAIGLVELHASPKTSSNSGIFFGLSAVLGLFLLVSWMRNMRERPQHPPDR